ncbi:MAG: MtrB/PioB family outer membrane beta-barrel protein [Deltaproteobacteria bacterium]|nr:MtrB/PioB family outer membrane beta-barrel protein [Deltaproteobacteria bacterium]
MNRSGCMRYLTAAAVLPTLVAAGAARAVDLGGGVFLEEELAGGAQLKDVSGSEEKFEEYRDVPKGFVLDLLRLTLERPQSADYLDLEAIHVLRDDASYRIQAGRHGKLRIGFGYDLTPHNFSRGVLLWGGFGTERLQIADVVQSQLQANEQTQAERGPPATDPNQDTTGEDAIQQSIVRGLYQGGQEVVFGLRRERTGASVEYRPMPEMAVRVGVVNENRRGARVLGTGTYERWNVGTGLAHTLDRFLVAGSDLAEPLNYQTVAVTVGVGIQKKRWLADLEYSFTDFSNSNDALLWDNPFRITDAQSAGPGNNFDRGRFAVGQIALVPDSHAHEIAATAAVDLPWHGRLGGSLSFGFMTQNEAFLPYTRNTAIVASNVEGTPSAASLALPARDLDGQVWTRSGTLSLALHPLERLGINARYRYYKYDGRSREVTFPGYAAFGESFWRTVKNDRNAPVQNEVFDFTRQDAELAVDVRILRPLSAFVEAAWEGTSMSGLRIEDMDELSIGGGMLFRPGRSATVKASYRYLDRVTDPYLQGRTAENPEATGLINFNWAERRRHQADARLQLTPAKLISLGALVRAADEEYSGNSEGTTVADVFRFGRTDRRSFVAGADLTLIPSERLSAFVSYAWEYSEERMANASKDDSAKAEAGSLGIADDYPAENYWNSNIFERVNTVGVGTTIQLLPDRLVLDAHYNFSYSDMDVETLNPNGVSSLTLANAVANDWPTLRNRLHQVVVDLHFRVTPDIRLGARYLFDWYRLDDFAWDVLEPYMAGQTVENSTRFLFADATYHGYRAHVVTIYATGRF